MEKQEESIRKMDAKPGGRRKPTLKAYNALIDACAKAGDVKEAAKWFSEAQQVGLKPNIETYNALINVCAKADDLTEASKWFHKAQQAQA